MHTNFKRRYRAYGCILSEGICYIDRLGGLRFMGDIPSGEKIILVQSIHILCIDSYGMLCDQPNIVDEENQI